MHEMLPFAEILSTLRLSDDGNADFVWLGLE